MHLKDYIEHTLSNRAIVSSESMYITPITKSLYPQLLEFCNKCHILGYANNSSFNAMRLEWCQNWGEFFCAIENNEIVSVAGCHPLPEVDPNAWRIFFRRCELPKRSPHKGLYKGPGQKGKDFMKVFLDYCPTTDLYITTNMEVCIDHIVDDNYKDIVRYNKLMELVAKHKDRYVEKVGEMMLYNTKQAVWKINYDTMANH